MSAEIVRLSGLDAALAQLQRDLPDKIEFEIEENHLSCLSFYEAQKRAAALRAFEKSARALGYLEIRHSFNNETLAWCYALTRTGAPVVSEAPKQIDDAIDI